MERKWSQTATPAYSGIGGSGQGGFWNGGGLRMFFRTGAMART